MHTENLLTLTLFLPMKELNIRISVHSSGFKSLSDLTSHCSKAIGGIEIPLVTLEFDGDSSFVNSRVLC